VGRLQAEAGDLRRRLAAAEEALGPEAEAAAGAAAGLAEAEAALRAGMEREEEAAAAHARELGGARVAAAAAEGLRRQLGDLQRQFDAELRGVLDQVMPPAGWLDRPPQYRRGCRPAGNFSTADDFRSCDPRAFCYKAACITCEAETRGLCVCVCVCVRTCACAFACA
jgi:hypothetical protein